MRIRQIEMLTGMEKPNQCLVCRPMWLSDVVSMKMKMSHFTQNYFKDMDRISK